MEPVTIAILATATFGVVTALTVFVRQLLLSRDQKMNNKAQRRALSRETQELEKIRSEMASAKRFDSHYKVIGENKEAIQYLDHKIDEILNKKFELVHRYAKLATKESEAMVDGQSQVERKALCDMLREEINQEIKFYDKELEQLQQRRASIWQTHTDLQEYLITQETSRNDKLDGLFHRHTSMLEKIYVRHHDQAENHSKQSIEAGTESIRFLTAPLKYILQWFKPSTGVSKEKAHQELISRREVQRMEQELNECEHDLKDEKEERKEIEKGLLV